MQPQTYPAKYVSEWNMFPTNILYRNGTHVLWPIIFFLQSLRYVNITEWNSYLCYVALQLYNWNSKSNFLTSYNRHGIHSQKRSSWCELCNYSAQHILFILLFLKRTRVIVSHKLNNRNKFGKHTGPLHSLDRASRYNYVRKTNKMLFFLNNVFQLNYPRHVVCILLGISPASEV